MPRRSTNATEKVADSPVVERRSTRSSTRKSVENASDVTSPEKPHAEDKSKTSPVKASPSQSGLVMRNVLFCLYIIIIIAKQYFCANNV